MGRDQHGTSRLEWLSCRYSTLPEGRSQVCFIDGARARNMEHKACDASRGESVCRRVAAAALRRVVEAVDNRRKALRIFHSVRRIFQPAFWTCESPPHPANGGLARKAGAVLAVGTGM